MYDRCRTVEHDSSEPGRRGEGRTTSEEIFEKFIRQFEASFPTKFGKSTGKKNVLEQLNYAQGGDRGAGTICEIRSRIVQ